MYAERDMHSQEVEPMRRIQAEREERKKTIQDLYLKCYTAEEIGSVVGLAGGELKEQVSSVSEDVRKQTKVTFSEPDYQPPIYNAERKEPAC